MARQHSPVCRLCRREGMKLFLKGSRCDTPKCAFERRESPPGMSTFRRGKQTDYGVHLREKQKVKHHYGLLEKQFRKVFAMAEKGKGNTGEALMSLLERRLDNVVYRLGFAPFAGAGPAAGRPRPRDGQRPAGRHSQLSDAAGRRDPREEPPQELAVGAGGAGRVAPRRARVPQPGRGAAARRATSSACPKPPTSRSPCSRT